MKQEKEKKGLPFFGIPKLAPYLKPYKMLFFWMVVTGTVGSGMDAIIPLFQQHAIDHFIADKTMQGVGGWLALYILVMIIQTATNYISAYGACKAELYIGRDLKRETFNHLQTLSFSYFNQNSVGYTHARVMSDTDRIASTLAWGLMEGVWYIAYLLLAIVMMFALNWKLALCVMVIVPVLVLSGAYFQKKLVFFHRRVREQNSKITGAFNEGITGAKTTKTLVIEDKVEQEFDDLTGEMKRLSVRAMHFRGVFMSTTAFAASIALAIVLWRGGVITRDGVILIGTLSVFMNYAQGTNVAIVGETGAGKSTLVNLVCRFFEPTQGRILIDGRDARERSQLWLHSNIGYVLQTPHLFSGTVLENLRYGRPDATMDEIEAAVKAVSADQIIARLPDGYNTDIGEGGNTLSTGEKQLLSFARALLADPRIFVLDEATSSVDTVTERLIQDAIEKVMAGRTSFIIAHRLSTIRRADVILVVHDGKIIESGTHRSLMEAKGAYYQLYTRQYREEQTRSMME